MIIKETERTLNRKVDQLSRLKEHQRRILTLSGIVDSEYAAPLKKTFEEAKQAAENRISNILAQDGGATEANLGDLNKTHGNKEAAIAFLDAVFGAKDHLAAIEENISRLTKEIEDLRTRQQAGVLAS